MAGAAGSVPCVTFRPVVQWLYITPYYYV